MAYLGNTPTTQAFTPAIDYFSGNGSTTSFTLSRPVASVAQVKVTVNNVPQNPSTAFTVSGNTLTFTGTPSSGTNNIYVQYTSPITQVIAPSQGTVGTIQLADNAITTAKIADNSVTTVKIAAGAVIQADLATNVGATGPAFDATADGTQVVGSGTYTKILFPSETFDTNNNFASSRFTPTVAGYYQINTCWSISTTSETVVAIYKNGAIFRYLFDLTMTTLYTQSSSLLMYLNGSTDYIEVYAYQSSGSNKSPTSGSYFSGSFVRAA